MTGLVTCTPPIGKLYHKKGSQDAALRLGEYADYECSRCDRTCLIEQLRQPLDGGCI